MPGIWVLFYLGGRQAPLLYIPWGGLLTLLQVDRNIPYLNRGTPSNNLTEDDADEIDVL